MHVLILDLCIHGHVIVIIWYKWLIFIFVSE
jgi:hypothetical protein